MSCRFTGTVTPRKVVLQDAAGNLYSLRGAEWFGATTNANTGGFQATFTGKFQVVSQGSGTVDSVNVVEHITFNRTEFTFDSGPAWLPDLTSEDQASSATGGPPGMAARHHSPRRLVVLADQELTRAGGDSSGRFRRSLAALAVMVG